MPLQKAAVAGTEESKMYLTSNKGVKVRVRIQTTKSGNGAFSKADAILLIDVSVSFQFSTIFDDHNNAEQKENVDTNNAKCCSEDHVEIDIGKVREWPYASRLGRGSSGIGAGTVCDKHW